MGVRLALLALTLVVIAFIALLAVEDIIQHGVSAIDVIALAVVGRFATGICGALWESSRRGE